MPHQIASLALLAAGSVVVAGCGDDDRRVPVYPAGGRVVSAGRPAARVVVVFHPVAPTAAPAGGPEVATIATETDEEGRYRLSTYEADDGAPAGDYVVTVRPAAASLEDGDGLARHSAPPAALARFARSATSPIKATVKAGDENRLDLDLK